MPDVIVNGTELLFFTLTFLKKKIVPFFIDQCEAAGRLPAGAWCMAQSPQLV
jgi:hypothetical protein